MNNSIRSEAMPDTVSKSHFKLQALKYFHQIQENGQDLIITDHGKPVLKISPFQEKTQTVLEELRNSVLRYDDPLEPVAQDDWDVLKK
jgi:PHD/YefM family antitoxin component YafN of YafNO toxin-antitoxin module